MEQQADKRCIFHIPWEINPDRASASQIRPLKMIQGFQDLGYAVSLVAGTAKNRRKAIQGIKAAVREGVRFDFCYSESSTGPLLLSSGWKDSLATLFADAKFLKWLNHKKIPLGLFYRDIYWKFLPGTRISLKNIIVRSLHINDLRLYNRTLDTLFLPSRRMGFYLPEISVRMEPLHPGCNELQEPSVKTASGPLNLVYVGGLGGHQYHMEGAFRVMEHCRDTAFLRLSTRPEDWKEFKEIYPGQKPDTISIQFLSGKDLEGVYSISEIGLLYLEPTEYFRFTMSFKLFEYLSFGLPVIAVKDTATGDFIEETGAGWVIPYDDQELLSLLEKIKTDRSQLEEKRMIAREVCKRETWKFRSGFVRDTLLETAKNSR